MTIDVNDLRIAATVLSLLIFLGICAWATARRNGARFAAAAQLPLHDDAAQLPLHDDAAQLPLLDDAACLPLHDESTAP